MITEKLSIGLPRALVYAGSSRPQSPASSTVSSSGSVPILFVIGIHVRNRHDHEVLQRSSALAMLFKAAARPGSVSI